MHNRMVRRVGLVALTVAAALVAGTAPASAAPGDGSAFGLSADLTALGAVITVGPLAPSSTDGPTSATLASISVPTVLTTGVVTTEAIRDDLTGVVHAEASVADVAVTLGALGTVGLVEAVCDATQAGNTGSTTLADVDLLGVTVDANPAPNTTIEVLQPGPLPIPLATIIFNEQIANADGSLTVNAIHIMFNALGLATGDVIISQARCGPAAPPIPLASGAGLWIGLGLLGAAAIPVGIVLRKRATSAV